MHLQPRNSSSFRHISTHHRQCNLYWRTTYSYQHLYLYRSHRSTIFPVEVQPVGRAQEPEPQYLFWFSKELVRIELWGEGKKHQKIMNFKSYGTINLLREMIAIPRKKSTGLARHWGWAALQEGRYKRHPRLRETPKAERAASLPRSAATGYLRWQD